MMMHSVLNSQYHTGQRANILQTFDDDIFRFLQFFHTAVCVNLAFASLQKIHI